jgi:outer membrane biogenesis lipoprotein LolB
MSRHPFVLLVVVSAVLFACSSNEASGSAPTAKNFTLTPSTVDVA